MHTQHFVYGMLQSFLEPINRKSRNTRKATVEGSRQEYPEHQQPHENRIAWTLNNLKKLDSLSNRGRTKAKQRKTQPMRQNVLNLNLILKTNDYLKEIAAWTILVKQNLSSKKSEPFWIEASCHPSCFIPVSDFPHALFSFRHRATDGETAWRSPAPFAGRSPSCHHN